MAPRLLRKFRESMGWEFIIPKAVYAELARLRVPPEVSAFLVDGTACIGRCDVRHTTLPKERLKGLGRGETEAICTVGECEVRTFREYVILTDDRAAQAVARHLGMSSLGTVGFLDKANREGIITADEAMAALEALEASGYHVDKAQRADFVRRFA